jgi:predicted AlkP superfamily pyrophosphatase or phosphodiesterase
MMPRICKRKFQLLAGSALAALFAAALVLPSATPSVADGNGPKITNILVISVDGMHQHDLDWYLNHHPNSALAKLVGTGVEYTANSTSRPSDSFPGLLAFFTGGTPISHGVFYDDTYDHTLFPPAAVNPAGACGGQPGTEVSNFEFLDSSWNIGAGQVTDLFNVLDPTHMAGLKTANGCVPVFPHMYLKNQTNTVFEVIHQAGMHTAWSDKHPAYEILAGASGKGLDELYAPEINSTAVSFTLNSLNMGKYPNNFGSCDPIAAAHCDVTLPGGMIVSFGDDWTTDPAETRFYDQIKVRRVLNWIGGLEADGETRDPKGTPVIYGMNFQAVSVAQKVTKAMQCAGAHPEDALSLVSTCTAPFFVRGGYYSDSDLTPEPPLQQSLDYVDGALGSMLSELQKGGHLNSTLIIVGAKHGQSPIDVSTLHMEPGSNPFATKDVADPADVLSAAGISLAQETADDVSLLWLTNHGDTAAAVAALRNPAFNVRLGKIYADVSGADGPVSGVWGDPAGGRVPDIIIQPLHGTIYTGSKKKLSEHGGFTGTTPTIANEDDNTHTALVVSNPHLAPGVVKTATSNMQIAPTILKALGLDPRALNAVQREGTTILPGLRM